MIRKPGLRFLFSTSFVNYYAVLKLAPNASHDDVKTAYKTLAKLYHPDIRQGFQDDFKAVNQAYQVLSDQQKRRDYDLLHQEELQQQRSEKQGNDQKFEESGDPEEEAILAQYRKIQQQYNQKYMKFKGNRDRAFKSRANYNPHAMNDIHRMHDAHHKRHFHKYNQPRPEDTPQYNQSFDRSKDSLTGFLGQQAKGLWEAWRQLRGKK